jgi:uncharacterized protein (DUF2235 family)
MGGKRIILLLDGTWNDSEYGQSDTNIVRLRELIAKSLSNAPQPHNTIVFYERGVGTGGFGDIYLGGAFGSGLERNIRRAYRFLCDKYEPGDQIFLLGFSRGAYTARSLAGFINAAGLLKSADCTPILESKAWYYYRTNPKDRFRSVAAELRNHVHSDALIECLAVFDTVGARGIPIPWFWRENRDLFEFHDVELSPISNTNFQALAIDEHRQTFQAAVWRRPKFGTGTNVTEQV